ncbi:MAG: hypothetical protein ACREMY_33290, partial [bacterium]
MKRIAPVLVAVVLLLGFVHTSVGAWDRHPHVLDIDTGRGVLDVIGQVNNLPATADSPLGSSQQFGYVSHLDGVASVFADSSPAQNESSALLTFFTDVKTTGLTVNGPLTVIIREGTTTFYRNSAPASFSSPDSFQSGEPVTASTIRQQVIVDSVERTFTVVNVNTLTETKFFELGDGVVRIGSRGDVIRTSLMGVLKVRDGSAPPPTGYFAGS